MIAHTITQHRLQQRQLLLSVAFPHLAWCPLRHTCSRHRPVSARDDGSSSSSGQCSACRAAAGEPFMPEQQTGQQQQPQPQQQSPALSSRDNIQLPNLTPPIPPRPPPPLSWMPPQLLTHLQALLGFLRACWALLPEFVSPSLSEASRRLCLVLGASLVMVVLVSTIDSGWLYLYLLNARRGVVVAA